MSQKKYWRMPSSLHFETIRKRREIIMKPVHKELIIDTSERIHSVENTEPHRADESSDDDDLFDNLRKMRESNVENVINKSSVAKPNNDITRNRKRTRSDSDHENSRKMQKIDEGDENSDRDEHDDILAFAKKTLQQDVLPDTDDIITARPNLDSDNSATEDNDVIVSTKRDKKKRRVVIDDDSD